jgi:hypothetical protein
MQARAENGPASADHSAAILNRKNFDSGFPMFDFENTLINGREAAV